MSKITPEIESAILETVHPDLREAVRSFIAERHAKDDTQDWNKTMVSQAVDTAVNSFKIEVDNDTGHVKPFNVIYRGKNKDPNSGSKPQQPVSVYPKNDKQSTYLSSMLSGAGVTFGVGPAGTGKTFLAVAVGLAMLHAGLVERVVITRPSVESGENLGFLPGDMNQKLNPFMRPVYDAIVELGGEELLNDTNKALKEASNDGIHFTSNKQKLEIAPLAFMRGRTFKNAFFVGDEMQNTTPEQMKMFLTRGGKGCIYAVCGDPKQFDAKQVGSKVSGLSYYLAKLEGYQAKNPVCGQVNLLENPDIALRSDGRYRLADNNTINIVEFEAKDVERHSVCAAICALDEADDIAKGKAQYRDDTRRSLQNKLARKNERKERFANARASKVRKA